MTTGTMSALEGDGSSLGGIVQPNWYYFFRQQSAGQDVFDSPISFPIPITGFVAADEFSTDGVEAFGDVLIFGSVILSEDGSDVFTSIGDSVYEGYLSVAEVGSDTLIAPGQLLVAGQLAVAETGADELAATGMLPISGAMAITEASRDSFLASGASAKPIVVSGGRRRTDLDWPDWPVYGPEQARVTKRKRDELLLLMS